MPTTLMTPLLKQGAKILHSRTRSLPETKAAVHEAKVLDAHGHILRRCWNTSGQELPDCGAALRKAERSARSKVRGAVRDRLWQRMSFVSGGKKHPVLIWLVSDEQPGDKTVLLAHTAARQSHESARLAKHGALRQALLSQISWLASRASPVPGAPALRATLSEAQILALAWRPEIAALQYFNEGKPASSTVYVDAVEGTQSYATGLNVGVCLIEERSAETPNNLTLAATRCAGIAGTHARCSAGLLRSSIYPNGMATGSNVHMANWKNCASGATHEQAVRWCADSNLPIWSVGLECGSADNLLYDYWARQAPWPLIVAPTGFDSTQWWNNCTTPCTNTPAASLCHGFNMLVVGVSDDCGTALRASHRMGCLNNSANNSFSGQEMPHLVAPGHLLTVDGITCGSGSSWSTAITAGAAAQLLHTNPALSGWGEAARSILMTLADEDIHGGPISLTDSVDDRDGVGELALDELGRLGGVAAKVDGGNVATDFGHDYGSIFASNDPAGGFYSEVWGARTAAAGKRLRVVLTWASSASCSDPNDKTTCGNSILDADFDLMVYQGSTLVGSSTSYDDGWEVVEIPALANTDYQIKIAIYSWTASYTYFGVSWAFGDYTTS